MQITLGNHTKMNIPKSTMKKIGITFALSILLIPIAQSDIVFRHTITGAVLDFEYGKEGVETKAVKQFLNTGENLYNGNEHAIETGENLYATACSGCHGHTAEGKLGPALGDDYWTYPKNKTDKGMFETIYGGARSMMGPQYNNLTHDEMLLIMSWVRSIYWGDPQQAKWLTEEQRATYQPAEIPADYAEALKNFNK